MEEKEAKSKLFSDFTSYMFQVVVQTLGCGCVSVVGIGANLINLVVFVRQGLWTDSVTASLAGLAVADLCCLLTMLWHSVTFAIMLSPPQGITWDPLSVLYITGGWPHVMFTRVTCWITAYVAFERCMCVVFPFKVKQIFTASRSMVVIGTIFVVIIASYVPIFYTHRLENVVDLTTNATKLRLVFTSNKMEVENICHYINDVIMPTFSLVIVIVSTRLTISYLNASMKWREKNAKSAYTDSENDGKLELQSDSNENTKPDSKGTKQKSTTKTKVSKSTTNSTSSSSKETRVVKMITLICTIFIACNSLCIIIIYLRFLVPEIANMGRYHNFFHILYSIDFLLESFNSTINILVYFKMSSRYKQEFKQLFGLEE